MALACPKHALAHSDVATLASITPSNTNLSNAWPTSSLTTWSPSARDSALETMPEAHAPPPVGSGLVTQYATDNSIMRNADGQTLSRRDVELSQPEEPSPSFTSDLSGALMSQELVNDVNSEVQRRVGTIRIQDGFWAHDSGMDSIEKDSRDNSGTYFGNGLTPDQELVVRQEMASRMEHYMILKGIPNFLSSREQTKPLGESYNKAMGMTKVNFSSGGVPGKPESIWHYSTGVDPFSRDITAWLKGHNDNWNFEVKQNVKNSNDLTLTISRPFKSSTYGVFQASSQFYLIRDAWHPKISHSFTPHVAGNLEFDVPLETQIIHNTVSSMSMSYSF